MELHPELSYLMQDHLALMMELLGMMPRKVKGGFNFLFL
jgi:hypothetical protein